MTEKIKQWNRLILYIPYENWDIVELYLYSNEIYSFEKIDPRHQVSDEDLETWLYFDKDIFADEYEGITVKIYTEKSEYQKLSDIKSYISDKDLGTAELDIIDDTDWANNWKDHYEVQETGDRLVIVPSWEDYDNVEDREVIILDPGMAFGTGHHETTRLMMTMMEDYLHKGDSVLDIGTGSGILSVAAAKLGADKILGTDIDEDSVKIARENSKLNNIDAEFIVSDLLDQVNDKYDLILSNIVAEIIIMLLPDLDRVIKEDGTFICSGITDDKLSLLKEQFVEYGYRVIEELNENEWNVLVVRRSTDV